MKVTNETETQVDTLFVAVVLYKKTLVGLNGKPEPVRQTIRIIKAKSQQEANEKMKKFWEEKMRSFSPVDSEITELIQ